MRLTLSNRSFIIWQSIESSYVSPIVCVIKGDTQKRFFTSEWRLVYMWGEKLLLAKKKKLRITKQRPRFFPLTLHVHTHFD